MTAVVVWLSCVGLSAHAQVASNDTRPERTAVVAGRVADAAGEPVIGVSVTAESAANRGPVRRAVAVAETDDRGEFRLHGLPSGEYLVRATLLVPVYGGPPRESSFYYPGAGDPQPIAVRPGEEHWAEFAVPVVEELDSGVRVRPPKPRNIISGRVTSADGTPLPRAMVRVESDGAVRLPPIRTDQDGRYEVLIFWEGAHVVTASKNGYMTGSFGQRRPNGSGEPLELRAGETRNGVDVVLSRFGALTGRVVDARGEPVEGAGLQALQVRFLEGQRRLVDAGALGTGRTDDRGVYRLYGLPPGQYIIAASVGQISQARDRRGAVVQQAMTDRPGYGMTYYPSATNPGEAQRITLGVAQQVSSLDIALEPAPTARIAGTIVDAAGAPVREGLILTPSRRSGVVATPPVGARIDAAGRFEFPNVPPGEYVIQASKNDSSAHDEGESLSQFVTVAGSDVTNLRLRLTRGSTLAGSVRFEGQDAPETFFGVDVQAVPVDMDRTPQNNDGGASALIEWDGSFVMRGLAGPRVLRLPHAPDGWMLKAILLDGRDVTDTPLPFGSVEESFGGIEVVLTDAVSEVAGRLIDARQRGVVNATVVLFPTSNTQWGLASRHFASTATGTDGRFRVRGVPPGDYYVAALTDPPAGDWRDPDLLDTLIPMATRVVVAAGEAVTIGLRARPR